MSARPRRRFRDRYAEDLGFIADSPLQSVALRRDASPGTDYDYTIPTPQGPHIVRIAGPTITCPSHDDICEEIAVLALGGLPCVCVGAALYLEFVEGEWGKTFFDRNPDLYNGLLSALPEWYAKAISALSRQHRLTGGEGPYLCLPIPDR